MVCDHHYSLHLPIPMLYKGRTEAGHWYPPPPWKYCPPLSRTVKAKEGGGGGG